MPSQKIGDINGPWAKWFKVTQILVPVFYIPLLALVAWLVRETLINKQFREAGDRYTSRDAAVHAAEQSRQFADIIEKFDTRLDEHSSESGHQQMEVRMRVVEQNQALIMSKLESLLISTARIEQKLEHLSK